MVASRAPSQERQLEPGSIIRISALPDTSQPNETRLTPFSSNAIFNGRGSFEGTEMLGENA